MYSDYHNNKLKEKGHRPISVKTIMNLLVTVLTL